MSKNCLVRRFKNLDVFGYPIRLNFDKKGSTHKTCIGSVATIIFCLVSVLILYQCIGHEIESLLIDENMKK